jgi:predicted transposase/invertase (TIGR01784 family)
MMVLSDETTRKHKEAILMQDENIRKAYEDLGRLSADKDIQRLYQIREDAARDYRSGMADARLQGLEEGLEKGLEKGLESGRQEGRQEGREEGRQEGLQEGSQQEKLRLVKKMLAQGIDEEMIKETADLTQAELDAIKRD